MLCAWLAPMLSFAQPSVVFDAPKHDMGSILWNNPAIARFTIKNSGDKPLAIENIEASCGCTVAKWDKKNIAPGTSSEISVSYNAEMLGHFTKQVAVYTNASKRPTYLTIYGNVVAQLPDYIGEYKRKIGDIKLNTEDIEFDDVNIGDTPVKTIEIFNEGTKTYKPELMHLPKYLSAKAIPETLLPNRSGKIQVTLNSRMLNNMGLTHTSVYLSRFPGDKVDEENEIGVSAVILPEAAQLSEAQLSQAPCISLSSDTLVLEGINEKNKASGTLTITNSGKSTLQIRSLQVFASALNVGVSRKIAPGKQTKLKITVLRKFLKQNSRNRLKVLMITNDPQQPKVIVVVKLKQ